MTAAVLSSNVLVCHFDADPSVFVSAFQDKTQSAFLLHFLKDLQPTDIDLKPNWVEITCAKQINSKNVEWMNTQLQSMLHSYPPQRYRILQKCKIYLKIIFELQQLWYAFYNASSKHQNHELSSKDIGSIFQQGMIKLEGMQLWDRISGDISGHDNYWFDLPCLQSQSSSLSPPLQPQQSQQLQQSPLQKSNSNHSKSMEQTNRSTKKAVEIDNKSNQEKEKEKGKVEEEEKGSDGDILMNGYSNNEDMIKRSFLRIKATDLSSSDNDIKQLPKPTKKPIPVESYELDNDLQYLDDNDNTDMNKVSLNEFTRNRCLQLDNKKLAQWIRERQYLINKRKELLKPGLMSIDGQKYRQFCVVDARSHDFVGGNINGVINCTFEDLEKCMPTLLLQCESASDVIFHCMYSQHRAPRCALKYWKARRQWERKYKILYKQRVWVLEGGFKKWISYFVKDAMLVSNFEEDYWECQTFPLTGTEYFYCNDWKPEDAA